MTGGGHPRHRVLKLRRMSCTLWGTTIPGWATDYVILLVCIVCCVVAAMQRRSGSGLFFLLMISTGLGFGVGGVSHMLLFFVEKEGEFCGSTWSEENNEWMYAWLVALLVTPFSPAALASMAVKNAQYRWSWMVILTLFLLALILAVVEAALFLALELELSGMMTGFWIMISSAFTVLVLLVDVWQNGFRWQIAYGVVSAGMYINGSLTLLLLSGVLPVAFNANALFHVFVILMVIFAFLYRSEPSTAKFQLAATPKSTQETPTAEAKVTEEI